jgi:hypothetical protein
MIKNLVILFLVTITVISCSIFEEEPQDIIDQDKMANLMYDVLLAESYAESYLMKDTTLNKDSILKVEMDKVLKVHGITAKGFSESYLYYKSHPVQLETVMDSAHERALRGRTDVFIRRSNTKSR